MHLILMGNLFVQGQFYVCSMRLNRSGNYESRNRYRDITRLYLDSPQNGNK